MSDAVQRDRRPAQTLIRWQQGQARPSRANNQFGRVGGAMKQRVGAPAATNHLCQAATNSRLADRDPTTVCDGRT